MNRQELARRPAIDVARVLALALVVAGHLLLATVDRDAAGEVRGANLLALAPGWSWVAIVAPMPVFLAAAGWANTSATLLSSARRLDSLVGVGAVVVAVWSLPVVVVGLTTGDAGLIGDGARIATQPLWFLAAYVPFAAAGAHLAALARRSCLLVVAAALCALALLDGWRFGADGPEAVGWVGFFLAWGIPWVLGAWWRGRVDAGAFDERRVGLALLVGGAAAAAALTTWAGYSAALIDTGSGARSNTTPPGLYTAVAGIAQVGALLLLAAALDRLGQRHRRRWDQAGTAAVGVYVWHLTALALCVGVVVLGLPVPTRLTPAWWLTRPLWWAAILGVTGALVVTTAAVRGRLDTRARSRPPANVLRLATGVVIATGGAALVGLEGPRTAGLAAACVAAFVGGWWLLRVRAPEAAEGPISR